MKTTKDVGRETASYWLQASLTGNPEQVANQFEVLKEAAIHILGTYAFNVSNPISAIEPTSEATVIMAIKDSIEDEVQFMKDNTDVKKMDKQNENL